MTILKSGQQWTLPAQLGQLKTEKGGKGLLLSHLWCPDDLPGLWDRIEKFTSKKVKKKKKKIIINQTKEKQLAGVCPFFIT